MSGQVSLLVADDSEICLLRGKPLKEHSIEDIRKELKKRRLNDKGDKSDLIKRLEDNILGQKCSPHWTRSQNRSKVVVHDHLTAIDPRGKQCFHCGIKKVLPYILPKDGMIYHFCSAECRFSNQIPNHGGHGENSKSQNDKPIFFEEVKDGYLPPKERSSYAEKFLGENAETYPIMPSKLRSEIKIGTSFDDDFGNDIAPIVIKPPTTVKFSGKPKSTFISLGKPLVNCSVCHHFKSKNWYILAQHQKSCQKKMEAKQHQMEPTLEDREFELCARCGKVLPINAYARHIAECQVSITSLDNTSTQAIASTSKTSEINVTINDARNSV